MSTPDRPLTRRQLKEMRRTGQLPVVTPEDQTESPVEDEEIPADEQQAQDAPATPESADATETASDPADSTETPTEPEEPVEGPAEPPAPLTRRELRMQRLRTSQLNVVSPTEDEDTEEAAEPSRATGANRLPVGFEGTSAETVARDEATEASAEEDASYAETAEVVLDEEIVTPQAEARAEEEPQTVEVVAVEEPPAPEESTEADAAAVDEDGRPKVGASFGAAVFQQAEERQRQEREEAEREAAARREAREREEAEREAEAAPVVSDAGASDSRPAPSASGGGDEATGRGDTGEVIAEAFQRSHDSSGSTAGNAAALILKDMPGVAALNAPITATGELILTSSHTLPEGFGSSGAATGTTDGKDVDAELIDGELPMHSSPSPIAASSAVSTSKAPGEVIRPPAPEKNHKLMLTLGITAGVLGVALIGVVVYVFASGVFTN